MDLVVSGSSINLPAHGSGGARARINNSAAKKSASPKARTSKPRRLFVRTGGGAGAYDLIGSHHALAVPVRSFSEGRSELI